MSEHEDEHNSRYEYGWADLNHAIFVNSVGASVVKDWRAADGGPMYCLTLAGMCVCGTSESAKSVLLRTRDAVNIIAECTRVVRDAGIDPDDLDARVKTLILQMRQNTDPGEEGGVIKAICRVCGAVADPICACGDTPWRTS